MSFAPLDLPDKLPKAPPPPRHVELFSSVEHPSAFRQKHAWIYPEGQVIIREIDNRGIVEVGITAEEFALLVANVYQKETTADAASK